VSFPTPTQRTKRDGFVSMATGLKMKVARVRGRSLSLSRLSLIFLRQSPKILTLKGVRTTVESVLGGVQTTPSHTKWSAASRPSALVWRARRQKSCSWTCTPCVPCRRQVVRSARAECIRTGQTRCAMPPPLKLCTAGCTVGADSWSGGVRSLRAARERLHSRSAILSTVGTP